jgi:hypothetical protein
MGGMTIRKALLSAGVAVWVAGAPANGAHAVGVTVRFVSPTGSDVGDCSVNPCKTIGYAIGQSLSGDTIHIAAGTYPEHLTVDRSLTLNGAGAGSTVIEGSGTGTGMTIGSSSDSLVVSVSGLRIQDGMASAGGGLSSVPGMGQTNRVVLTRVVVSGNEAVGAPDAAGAAIYNAYRSTMTLSQSRIAGNAADGAAGGTGEPGGAGQGGGLYNAGTLEVTKSTISGNSAVGGAGGRADSFFGEPGGAGQGGGLYNAGTLEVTKSTIASNTAAGGAGGISTALGYGGLGGSGLGGGLYDAPRVGSDTMANVTLTGNKAAGGHGGSSCPYPCHGRGGDGGDGGGGGIFESAGSETHLNVTVASNRTIGGRRGCGIGVCGSDGTTFGGGIDMFGSVAVTNTILAGNSAINGPDCFGSVSSGGHNLLGDDTSCSGFTGSGDLLNVDPLLGPLHDNGGPTFTMALGPGSPAIDAGDDAVCAPPPVNGVDQRGKSRPSGPHCDMGAFEVEP